MIIEAEVQEIKPPGTTYALWDKVSPLDGIPAEVILRGFHPDVVAMSFGITRNSNGELGWIQPAPTDEEALAIVQQLAEQANNPPSPPAPDPAVELEELRAENAMLRNEVAALGRELQASQAAIRG